MVLSLQKIGMKRANRATDRASTYPERHGNVLPSVSITLLRQNRPIFYELFAFIGRSFDVCQGVCHIAILPLGRFLVPYQLAVRLRTGC